ncbi:hypothetical protein NON20_18575 [Synechocystis sp. B12]|nr:hypothetical protein NON20_18575 [Synechocystis sp. B12]
MLIFGNSTKDLLDAALGTGDLIISVENAQVKDFVSLGDFDGDGLADFGVIDDQGNFFLVLGSPELGSQGSLVIDSTLPNLSNFNQAGESEILMATVTMILSYKALILRSPFTVTLMEH